MFIVINVNYIIHKTAFSLLFTSLPSLIGCITEAKVADGETRFSQKTVLKLSQSSFSYFIYSEKYDNNVNNIFYINQQHIERRKMKKNISNCYVFTLSRFVFVVKQEVNNEQGEK
jgi:hypothetical protein